MMSLFLRLLVFIFCRRGSSGTPARILLLRVDERMGNLILTTPLLAGLRSIYPEAQLDILAARRYSGLLSENEYKTGIIAFEKRDLFKHPLSWLRLLLKLRRAAYDIVIDASHEHVFSVTSALLTLWVGSPVRIGHKREGFECVYSHTVTASPDDMSEALRKLRLLAPLNSEAQVCRPWLGRNTAQSEKWADEWLTENNPQAMPVLAVFTGARKSDRRLTPTDFMFVADVMKKNKGWKILFIGGLEDEQALESLRLLFSQSGGALYAPDVDLYALRALLARSAAVICADTGPLHLAWALGRPLLSLHTAGNVARWGHTEGTSRAISFVSGSMESQQIAAQALIGIIAGSIHHENT